MIKTPPDKLWADEICKIGQGHACCRYLTVSPAGWSCEKHSPLRKMFDRRVARKEMVARGDNCEGRGSQ